MGRAFFLNENEFCPFPFRFIAAKLAVVPADA